MNARTIGSLVATMFLTVCAIGCSAGADPSDGSSDSSATSSSEAISAGANSLVNTFEGYLVADLAANDYGAYSDVAATIINTVFADICHGAAPNSAQANYWLGAYGAYGVNTPGYYFLQANPSYVAQVTTNLIGAVSQACPT